MKFKKKKNVEELRTDQGFRNEMILNGMLKKNKTEYDFCKYFRWGRTLFKATYI